MTELTRAFIAVELSDRVRDALRGLIEDLRRAEVRGMRLVRPERIHLTLRFLGAVAGDRLRSVAEAVSRVSRNHRAFTLELGAPGAFPNTSSARVLWVGIEGGLSPLLDLQRELEDAIVALGFPREDRPFRPHLTVAQFKGRGAAAGRRTATERLFAAGASPGLPIEVDGLSLMSSKLLPDGAVYERLGRMPLGESSRNARAGRSC